MDNFADFTLFDSVTTDQTFLRLLKIPKTIEFIYQRCQKRKLSIANVLYKSYIV